MGKWLVAKNNQYVDNRNNQNQIEKTEEDALDPFILSEIKEKGECVYFHYGVGWGNNWPQLLGKKYWK